MNTLTKIHNLYPDNDTITKFSKWYRDSYVIPIDMFATYASIFQLQMFHQYLEYEYDIAVHFDNHSIVIYTVAPELKANEILANWNKTGIFTNVLYKEYDLPYMNNTNAFERAILKAFQYVNKDLAPF